MKLIVSVLIFLFSLSSFSQTPYDFIAEYEVESNVKCTYIKSSLTRCINYYCKRSDFYSCLGATGEEKLKLSITRKMGGDGVWREKVTKVKFLKRTNSPIE